MLELLRCRKDSEVLTTTQEITLIFYELVTFRRYENLEEPIPVDTKCPLPVSFVRFFSVF